MNATRFRFSAALAGLFLFAFFFGATPATRAASPAAVCVSAPIADSVSWDGFTRYWTNWVKSADRVILVVGLIAAAALFIITRGKWLKH
ncbi:MAG: hypothetical protein ACJ8F7_07695 [Gemmataceae bacterium]